MEILKSIGRTLISKIAIGIWSFLLGAIVFGIVMYFMAPGMMIHEKESPLSFAETVDTIISNAEDLDWKVPKVYDMQKSISDEGYGDIGKLKIIELCQPDYAHQLLSSDSDKYVSVMMPCAVAVYEKENGKVYVSSMNIGMMGKLFGGGVNSAMSKVADDDDVILEFLD